MRVAIVHHWFVNPWCGAERVVEAIARIFPEADLFAMMSDPRVLPPDLRRRRITTSFLQRIPGRYLLHRQLMPLYPLALEQFDLSSYDVVISSDSAPAKGVITSSNTCHICYCHSPMRYIWDMYSAYRRSMSAPVRAVFTVTSHYARLWDLASASRVDYFVANSENVARRIRKHYRRESEVIRPPVRFSESYLGTEIEDYYLVLGRLVDYKKVDLAVEACNRMRRPLKVVGDGPQMKRLRKMAGSTVEFLGELSDDAVREAYSHCRALLFPGDEDFGLVPLEAQSFGRPVIAYGRGGALETVTGIYAEEAFSSTATGVFFQHQTAESLMDAIVRFERDEAHFSPEGIRAHASQFSEEKFEKSMLEFVEDKWDQFRQQRSYEHRASELCL